MNMTITLEYATKNKETLTDLFSVLYSIITYDVIGIIVEFGSIKKHFILYK